MYAEKINNTRYYLAIFAKIAIFIPNEVTKKTFLLIFTFYMRKIHLIIDTIDQFEAPNRGTLKSQRRC